MLTIETMATIDDKRERIKNFTVFEKELLLELVKDQPVVLSKQRDGPSLKAKVDAWISITSKFNEHAEVTKRDADALKVCTMNLTSKAKKDDCIRKKAVFQTGGGPPPPTLSSLSSTMVELMPQTFTSLLVNDDDCLVDENSGKLTMRVQIKKLAQLNISSFPTEPQIKKYILSPSDAEVNRSFNGKLMPKLYIQTVYFVNSFQIELCS